MSPKVKVFSGDCLIEVCDQRRAAALAGGRNVSVRRRKGVITRIYITEWGANGSVYRERRPNALKAEECQTTCSEKVGPEDAVFSRVVQHIPRDPEWPFVRLEEMREFGDGFAVKYV